MMMALLFARGETLEMVVVVEYGEQTLNPI
jgi:hypothetical protein